MAVSVARAIRSERAEQASHTRARIAPFVPFWSYRWGRLKGSTALDDTSGTKRAFELG
jgi:hypothetical protein